MSDTVIRVENLGKKYIIGRQKQERYLTLRDAIAQTARSVGQHFLPSKHKEKPRLDQEEFWALKDVSFEIKQGDRVGFIGQNGAGKSTLLKILSRITEPTKGSIRIQGRVASLLEVGTGFHAELTGRENIYLNGAILGMSRVEIKKKFDEIIYFAEVERFLDTPVKHYSSGMYVRLAFSVAAHLEPEILIVDEVLAVGDAQFQKKCLGKMENVAKEGRTILFVSHNMAAIRSLCSRALLMKRGQLITDSDFETAISNYLSEGDTSDATVVWNQYDAPQSPEIRFTKAYILNDKGQYASSLDCRKEFSVVVEYEVIKPLDDLRIGFFMQNLEGVPICGSNDPNAWPATLRNPGYYISKCTFPGYLLNAAKYSVFFGADIPPYTSPLVTTPYCLSFTIEDVEGHGSRSEKLPGIIRPKLNWNVKQLTEV
ncbi:MULTISPECIES: ABC transporter ATP-binding protein [Trichocoleus]|uniref:ABC transporter ATP-binding protein n=1 Tax=Trichocoleus desertorum GB2-A4 TaxID=2933944 RepID=A0ABV0J7A5_9CYAN|nr:ABC transporter ATP-binding protein [Trichocoleus sp. FACHB-46]MBD1862630.1 ABC transporter ATP-binding protein [Trichocoleus sp. FACHB-46]